MEDPPSSRDVMAQIRPRRWPVVVGLIGFAVVAVVAAVVMIGRVSRASREREARAWATLQRCLLGTEPLTNAETPSDRLRRIQLTAVGVNWRAKGQDAWPGWCSSRAHALHEALREAGHEQAGTKDLGYWSEHLGKELHDHPYPESDIGGMADSLWAVARAQDLPSLDAEDVPTTPAAAQPLTVDALRALSPLSVAAFPLDRVHEERVPTESMRLLVAPDPATKASFLCTAHANADVLACATLPSSLGHVDARMLGAAEDGAAPLLFAAPSGESGIYRSADGTLLDEAASYGGFVRADGFATEMGWDRAHDQFRLRRGRPGQPPRDALFRLDNVVDDSQVALLWDAVIWAANGAVSMRHVLDGDAPMGTTAMLARVVDGGITSHGALRACKTLQALALLVRGVEEDTVTIDTGDQWSTPITYPAVAGRIETLTCRGTEVTLTAIRALMEAGWVEGSVTQARCSPGACASRTTELSKVFPDVKETMPVRIAAADLDGKLLLVWQAGTVGGLRMRLAPQEHIEEPADTVVYDDEIDQGTVAGASTLLGWTLFARGTYAVLLLSTTAGVHAVRIDASGRKTSLRVEWSTAPVADR
jgi:hypothetical protein